MVVAPAKKGGDHQVSFLILDFVSLFRWEYDCEMAGFTPGRSCIHCVDGVVQGWMIPYLWSCMMQDDVV